MPYIHPDMNGIVRAGFTPAAKAYWERAWTKAYWQLWALDQVETLKVKLAAATHPLLRPPYVKE